MDDQVYCGHATGVGGAGKQGRNVVGITAEPVTDAAAATAVFPTAAV